MTAPLRQWDVVRVRIKPEDRDEHPAVIISVDEICASAPRVNVLHGTTRRPGAFSRAQAGPACRRALPEQFPQPGGEHLINHLAPLGEEAADPSRSSSSARMSPRPAARPASADFSARRASGCCAR
jgi:hypothetical protein